MTVAELLENPAHFVKGVEAADAAGNHTRAQDPQARRWCLVGAVHHCYPDDQIISVLDKLYLELFGMDSAIPLHPGGVLTAYNDDPKTSARDVAELAQRAGV